MHVVVRSLSVFAAALLALSIIPAAASASDEPPPLPPGEYECRISKEYKFRPCQVVRKGNDGVVQLVIPDEGHLVALSGPLHPVEDERGVVYLEAKLIAERPWPCYRCQARCSEEPGSCACIEVPAEGSAACRAQRLGALLKRKGKTWRGPLPVKLYHAEVDVERKVATGHTFAVNVFDLTLRPRRGGAKKK